MKPFASPTKIEKFELEKFWNSIESGRWNLDIQDYHVILILIFTFKVSGTEDKIKSLEDVQSKLEGFWRERGPELHEIFLPFKPLIQKTSETTVLSFWNVFHDFKELIESQKFSKLFDFLLFKITKIQGKFSGDFLQPNELTEFILEFMKIKDESKVYNPFGGLASFGVFLNPSVSFKGQELNPVYCAIGKLRLLSYENEINHVLDNEDSIKNWNPKNEKFDLILTFPPIGFDSKSTKSDNPYPTLYEFIIQNSLKYLSPNGKLGLIISNGVLSSEGSLKKLRETLINTDRVEAIINFPSNLLFHTAIPFSFIVITKNNDVAGEIRFIDATDYVINETGNDVILNHKLLLQTLEDRSSEGKNDFFVSTELIKKHGYNLSISRYQWDESYSGSPLSNVLSKFEEELFYAEGEGRVVSIKDLKDDVLDYNLDTNSIEYKPIKKNLKKVNNSALLISLRGNKLKSSWFKYDGTPIFVTNDIQAFSINHDTISLDYLLHKLYSKNILEQHRLLSRGASISYISIKDVLELKLEIPKKEEQLIELKELREKAIEDRLISSGLKNEIEKLKIDQKEDLSLKKHNIMQHMNNVKESATRLFKLMTQNQGILNWNEVINESTNMTVKKRFEIMMESINDSLYYIDNITNEVDYGKEEVLYAWEYFNEVRSKGPQSNDRFEIKHAWDIGTFFHEIVGDRDKYLYEAIVEDIILYNGYMKISKESFQELYNNIIENAIRHGFTEKNKKYLIDITISSIIESDEICFSFKNNGNPFPKGLSDRYGIKGEKAGKFGNKGIGSWKVCDIVNHFGGRVVIHDLPEEEFPVIIDVILPIPYNESED